MRTLIVSANAATLRRFARSLVMACNAAIDEQDGTASDGAIEVSLECEHNGPGSHLVVRFDNDDCEGPHIEDGQVLWDEDDD